MIQKPPVPAAPAVKNYKMLADEDIIGNEDDDDDDDEAAADTATNKWKKLEADLKRIRKTEA